MRTFNATSWATQKDTKTDAGNFCGVAIGPSSEESLVLVNGVRLQAGRVLPLRTHDAGYSVQRLIGNAGTFTATGLLELLLFECSEELAIDVRRPTRGYTLKATTGNVNNGGYTRLLTVPYSGRRAARVLVYASAAVGYQVVGRTYCPSTATVKEYTISTVAPAGTGAPIVFYIGGNDSAELYDELAIEGKSTAATADMGVDVDVFGELGL